MITIKGKVVTFTGKDEQNLQDLANKLGKTPQEAFIEALKYQMQLNKTTKKTNKRGKKQ